MNFDKALELEFQTGLETIASGETLEGADGFAEGKGKHGAF